MYYEIKAEQLDKIIEKKTKLVELLDRYFLSKTRPSLDELIECEVLKSELVELEQESKEHSEKLGGFDEHYKDDDKFVESYLGEQQPSIENCDNDCNGPDCEGCRDFKPKEQQHNKEAEVILENELNNNGFSFNEKLKPKGISISFIRKSKKAIINAMQEYAQQHKQGICNKCPFFKFYKEPEAYSKKRRREELEKFMEYLEEEIIDIVYQNDEQEKEYLINQYLNPKL